MWLDFHGRQHPWRTGLITVLVVLMLIGCTVGPDYHPPQPVMPRQWRVTPGDGLDNGPLTVAAWWTLFGDTRLNALIAQAVAANRDLRIATARVCEARAQRRAAAAEAWPTVDASGSYTRLRRSENVPTSAAREQDLYQAGFDAGWEMDLFGGVRRATEAAEARLAAAEENRRDVLVSLLAEVATNYLALRGNQRRLAIARENIKIQQETVALTQGRLTAGLGNRLSVVQAQALLAGTEAQVPVMEADIRQAIHRLGVLLGLDPDARLDALLTPAPIPETPLTVPIGLPSDLLRRRPDIRRAERELAVATADVGVATADLFPHFSLDGLFGLQSTLASHLFALPSRFWTFGPSLRWPVFDAGRARAAIQVQTARQEEALAIYEKTVLEALAEVEIAMVAVEKGRATDTALSRAVETTRQSADMALELYQQGLVDFLNLLQSELSLYQVQDQYVQHRQALATYFVALFKALGGGWELAAPDRAASPPAAERADTDSHRNPSPMDAATGHPSALQ